MEEAGLAGSERPGINAPETPLSLALARADENGGGGGTSVASDTSSLHTQDLEDELLFEDESFLRVRVQVDKAQ